MKKLKHEAELIKAAMLVGMKYAEARGAAKFEAIFTACWSTTNSFSPCPRTKCRNNPCATNSPSGIRSSCRKITRC
jgi:hypothetical protein